MVSGLLAATSALTGALAGFVAGAAWRVVADPLSWVAVVVVAGGAVVLDASCVPAPSVRRQVPQLWGRIFSTPTVAVLYGARLGVGPLTILRTWVWWAALIVGASAGPWWSAGVGATFGLARIVAMLVAGPRAGAWQSHERRWTIGLAAFVMAVVVGASLAAGEPDDATDPADPSSRSSSVPGSSPARRATTTSAPATSTTAPPAAPPDRGLGALLPDEVLPGFDRIADDPARRLGPLDLAAAAAIESDEPAERALLETRCFQAGHARGWRAGEKVAYASVYEFATPADAEAYRLDGLTTIEGRGARLYDVEAPAGGRGFSQAEQAQTGAGSTVAHGVTFVRGARFFLVFVTSPDSSLGPADAATAAGAVASAAGG